MKKSDLFFMGCFLMIISLPFIFMDHKTTVSKKENRVLAAFPNIIITDGKIDIKDIVKFPQLLDNYINDRFGFKNSIVSLMNTLNQMSKRINGNVIIGKDGWLFYSSSDDGKNIDDFFKTNLLTDAEMTQLFANIKKRLEWCNSNDIKFILLIASNKHNVYPEYYPFVRPNGVTRMEQIMAEVPADIKDVIIYPFDYIIENKTKGIPLYFETDTHWNMAGACCASDVLLKHFEQMFPGTNFPEIKFDINISFDTHGDIVGMLGLTSYGKRTIPNLSPMAGWESYYQHLKNEGRNGVITKNNDQSLPRAVIFRDSFFTALEPFVSVNFSFVEYNWRQFIESDKNYILENKPDIIIWEIAERYISIIPHLAWD
jgi:hypothetical protein